MGFALTSDLSTFNKIPSSAYPPFHGDTSWMYWYENQWSNYRDPGFFKENDTCYMVHTAHTPAWKAAIALATSTDYFTWHDAGPIYVADNWHAIESVFLMKRNSRYHLFFTEETTEGISHMSSDSLRSGWNIATRTVIDLGAAAEVLDLGDDRYYHLAAHEVHDSRRALELDTLRPARVVRGPAARANDQSPRRMDDPLGHRVRSSAGVRR